MLKNIISIILVSLLVFGCSKKDENQPGGQNSPNGKKNETEVTQDKGIYLNYDLEKGTNYKFAMSSFKKTSETVSVDTSEVPQSMTESSDYIISFLVSEKDNDGNLTLDMKCEQVKAKGENSAGQKLEYDSKNPPKDTSQKAMFINYEILTSNNFFVRINKIGEILDIFKFEKLLNGFISKLPKQPSASEKENLRQSLKEEMLKPLVTQVFKNLTYKELKKDSSWTVSFPGQLAVFQIENKAIYKVNKIYSDGDNQFARVESSLEVKFSGKNEYSEEGVNYKFQTPKTTAVGMILFDLNKKIVSKATSEIYLEMTMTAKELKAGGKSGTRKTKIETKNSLQLLN